jgi:signal transduction histidine kinase
LIKFQNYLQSSKFYNRSRQLASITQKRLGLHQHLKVIQQQKESLQSQLDQVQHLATMGTVSYMIAHEINNLLTPLKSYASLALNNPDDKALTEKALQKTVQNCENASRIMESMLALVSGDTQNKQENNLSALIEDIFSCLCRDFSKDGISVKILIPEGLIVWAVPVQIQQVMMNLILNARHAMLPGGGILTIKAAEKKDITEIEVADTGKGIAPADLERIFELFFTTKNDKNASSERCGSGLGLAFCKRVIEEHEGSISVESKSGNGSKFTITLPKPRSGNR